MKKRSGYFTKAEVIEAFRLALGKGKVPDSVFREVMGSKEPEPCAAALEFLGVEPVEQLYRRRVK